MPIHRSCQATPGVGGVLTPLGLGLFGIAGMAAFTAVSGCCPVYAVLGISSCPVPQRP